MAPSTAAASYPCRASLVAAPTASLPLSAITSRRAPCSSGLEAASGSPSGRRIAAGTWPLPHSSSERTSTAVASPRAISRRGSSRLTLSAPLRSVPSDTCSAYPLGAVVIRVGGSSRAYESAAGGRAYHEAMATAPRLDPIEVAELGSRLRDNISRAVKAPDRVVRALIVALLAEGHVLIEDAPGVGKTALARALARSLDAEDARVQCTSDLLPADLIGTNVFNQRESRFEFHPGPVFANIVLVDEINRASPKTQSGLLECMQERQITIDGHKPELARPFVVLATQNPAEYDGNYPLPDAELDRFMVRVTLGYPPGHEESAMLAEHADRDPVEELVPVADVSSVRGAQAALAEIEGTDALRRYVVAICDATRKDDRVELGASPRAGLMLFRAAKALAALEGRDHVLPDDVQALAPSVLAHRLLLSYEVDGDQRGAVIRQAIDRVPAL